MTIEHIIARDLNILDWKCLSVPGESRCIHMGLRVGIEEVCLVIVLDR